MKIRGNTVGASNPRPDWKQSDAKKADFIKNKPEEMSLPAYTEDDYGKVLSATATGLQWVKQSGGSGGGSIYALPTAVNDVAVVDDIIAIMIGNPRPSSIINYAVKEATV